MKDVNDVFDHSVFAEMKCPDYNYDLEQAHYHFTLSELVHYIQVLGIDKVMIDVYDMLADECNTKVSQLEMEYE